MFEVGGIEPVPSTTTSYSGAISSMMDMGRPKGKEGEQTAFYSSVSCKYIHWPLLGEVDIETAKAVMSSRALRIAKECLWICKPPMQMLI
jgi:hypothetical protein